MKRTAILTAMAAIILAMPASAKTPKWFKSQKNSVIHVITYDKDGQELARSNGFFISADGTGITDLSVLKNAYSAVTVDAAGTERPIQVILGANDMYDAARFQVTPDKKLSAVSLAGNKESEGSAISILPFGAAKAKELVSASVSKSMDIDDSHFYYNLSLPFDSALAGCPVINESGEVVGMVQNGMASDTVTYALDARFVADIEIVAMSLDTRDYSDIHIRKSLPQDVEQALAYVYIKQSTMDSKDYGQLLEDFLIQFPDNPDGLFNLGSYLILETDSTQYTRAEELIARSIELSDEKDRMHCDYANLIYTTLTDNLGHISTWTLEQALDEVKTAISIDTVPTYYQLQGNIEFAMQRYPEALASFRRLNASNLSSADTYLLAYTACSRIEGATEQCIELLDTAILKLGKPMPPRAGTLLIERAGLEQQAGRHREAVQDFNRYEELVGSSSLNATFFYLRHQAEIEARMYEQALDDISMARELAPQDSTLILEHASLLLRIGDAQTAQPMLLELVEAYPENPDVQRLMGVCYLRQDNRKKAVPHLEKARDLGDSVAARLLEQ